MFRKTRTRFQKGSLRLKTRAKGERYWELRSYEGGRRKRVTVGTLRPGKARDPAMRPTPFVGQPGHILSVLEDNIAGYLLKYNYQRMSWLLDIYHCNSFQHGSTFNDINNLDPETNDWSGLLRCFPATRLL